MSASAVPDTPAKSKTHVTAISPATVSPRLNTLNLHDKIAQMIVVRGYGDIPSKNNAEFRRFQRWIKEDHVGGFIVAGRIRNGNVIRAQPYEMVTLVNRMQRLAKTPLLVASDFERGASGRVAGTPQYPYLMAFGAAHDDSLVRRLGIATAQEARAVGVNWVFAPDADVNNNPDNPIINTRSFGEDPKAVAQGVQAFIRGAHSSQGSYVLVTTKHFPGHGDTSQDSHMQLATVTADRERMRNLEFVPFRASIEAGVDAVMTGHLNVPSIESEKIPATVSHRILTDVLRDELKFEGLVVTDALEMQGVASLYSQGELAVKTVEAGADVLLMPNDPGACIRALMAAVSSGRIPLKRINQSVSKILVAKAKVGLMRSRTTSLENLSDELARPDNARLAQEAADRAFTLVKDAGHLFPAAKPEGTCAVVVGESLFTQRGEAFTTELRSSIPNLKTYVVTPAVPEQVLAAVAENSKSCSQIYAAAFITVEANRGSVALEGALPKFMNQLAHSSVPTALISFGNPYLLRDFPDVAAYASTFSTTDTSERAAARALLGKIDISGRMPVSIPGLVKVGDGLDVPAHHTTASK